MDVLEGCKGFHGFAEGEKVEICGNNFILFLENCTVLIGVLHKTAREETAG